MQIDTSQRVTLGFLKVEKCSLKVQIYKAMQGMKLHATFLGLELIFEASVMAFSVMK